MTAPERLRPLAVLGLLATVLVAAGSAWACVPQARLLSLQPASFGAAGTQVRVNGLGFDEGPAEVRWNSPDGPQLATANGPNFSVQVTIPASPPGLYSIIALSRLPGGGVGNAGSAAFQVTGAGGVEDRPAGATGEGAAPRPQAGSERSSGVPAPAAAAGGIGLLGLGALAGAVLARGRKATAPKVRAT